MITLKAEKRDMSVKAKQLRRQGLVIGNLSGRDRDGSLPIQMDRLEAERLLKKSKAGTQLMLEIGDEKITAIIKGTEYDSMKKQITNIDLQQLVAGEKITATAQIELVNADAIKGDVRQEIYELTYKAMPADLVEKVIIDLSKMTDLSNIEVKDLDIAKAEHVEVVTAADSVVVTLSQHRSSAEVAPAAVAE